MKAYNNITVRGRIHSCALEERETEKGTAIAGTVTVEVSEEGTLVESRFFAYPKYNSGKVNRTYPMLENIMVGDMKSIVNDGDDADWIEITGSVDVSYFVGREGAESIDDLYSSRKFRGSFINQNKKKEYGNVWKCDMLITRVEEIDADVERNLDRKVRIRGYLIDSYYKRLLNVYFDALDEAAMNHLLSLSVSNDEPLYTSVRGEFRTITTLKITEGIFGGDERNERDDTVWALTWMPRNPYMFGEDITDEEYKECSENLDKHKTEVLEKYKSEQDEEDELVF